MGIELCLKLNGVGYAPRGKISIHANQQLHEYFRTIVLNL